MPEENVKLISRSSASGRIIAVGIVFAFLYWASSVVMTLLLAVLVAYLLDPVVGWFERLRMPRAIGALLVLLSMSAIFSGLGYLVLDRADEFAADWPRYSAVLRHATLVVNRRLAIFEKQVADLAPEEERARPAVRIEDSSPVRTLLLRGLGSLYSIMLVATFLPFLIFFMLAGKRRIWHATMELFPIGQRTEVKETLDEVSAMLRGYVAGNALVALILALGSWAFFWMINLDYPFLAGTVSGLLTMVPYLGAVLAWVPPFLIGMTKWKTFGPFFGVAAMLTLFHIIALNVLMPAIVGRRVHLNAVSVTIALLFWGWLWGAIGLILAIPITATVKVICDHVESYRPVGRWLGA